ncbi:MAG: hypothetical protein ACLS2V_12625 [Clostridium paraputrificum]|uniref:hypothetical protein n=1 Tax=Clostridium sp. TaxID=1506 RepID=UPI0025BE013C|nr:hypothetical protein [Clostridium sp.]MBS5926154.1 hypothetical protein [Clostridium sp.]
MLLNTFKFDDKVSCPNCGELINVSKNKEYINCNKCDSVIIPVKKDNKIIFIDLERSLYESGIKAL